jgi:predicted SnoaL-like aldol condensation-catalyzing enzyme
MGSLDENKQVVLRQIEALNAGELEALERLVHADFCDHGRRQAKEGDVHPAARLRAAFAGTRLEPLDIIAEDDRVTVRARLDGDLSRQQIHIWRILDGLIVEHWQSTQKETS